jgi:predicted site-specific integrase-resolvase
MSYVKLREACERTGLHPHTLRKYADTGVIRSIRTPSGQRLFDIDSFVGDQHSAHVVLYARVSSRKQKDDLERQVAYLKAKEPHAEVVTDIASGLNFNREGLKAILERSLQGDKLTVVVAHRDRLARFGFDLIEWLIQRNGGQIVVLSKSAHTSPTDELLQDLLAVLSVFAARMHGLRKYRDQIAQDTTLSDGGTERDIS